MLRCNLKRAHASRQHTIRLVSRAEHNYSVATITTAERRAGAYNQAATEHQAMETSQFPTQPMELRPLSLGEILDRIAQLYRSHFLLFAGINIFPSVVLLLIGAAQIVYNRLLGSTTVHLTSKLMVTVGGISVGALIYAVLLGVSLAATNRAVSNIYLGLPATIAGTYREVKPHWFRYIWLMFVAGVYAWAPIMLLFVVIGGGAALATTFHVNAGLTFLPVILLFLLGIPLGIWMTLRYSLSVPASIFEDLRIHASLKRSVFLTKGSRGRILVLMLLVIAVSIILSLVVNLPLAFIGTLVQKHTGSDLLIQIGTQLGNFIVQVLLGPVYGIGITLFYYDERIRKEGFDIEWLMRGANLMPAASPLAFENNAALDPSTQNIPERLSPPAAEPDAQ